MKKLSILFTVVLIVGIVISGCGKGATEKSSVTESSTGESTLTEEGEVSILNIDDVFMHLEDPSSGENIFDRAMREQGIIDYTIGSYDHDFLYIGGHDDVKPDSWTVTVYGTYKAKDKFGQDVSGTYTAKGFLLAAHVPNAECDKQAIVDNCLYQNLDGGIDEVILE